MRFALRLHAHRRKAGRCYFWLCTQCHGWHELNGSDAKDTKNGIALQTPAGQ